MPPPNPERGNFMPDMGGAAPVTPVEQAGLPPVPAGTRTVQPQTGMSQSSLLGMDPIAGLQRTPAWSMNVPPQPPGPGSGGRLVPTSSMPVSEGPLARGAPEMPMSPFQLYGMEGGQLQPPDPIIEMLLNPQQRQGQPNLMELIAMLQQQAQAGV